MKAERQVAPEGGIHSPPSPAQDGSRAELSWAVDLLLAVGTDRLPPAGAASSQLE